MLSDFQNLLDQIAPDDAGKLTVDDRNRAITLAVIRYSKDRPRSVVEDVAAVSARYLGLPTEWSDSISVAQEAEYPIGNIPPTYLEGALWRQQLPNGVQIGVPVVLNIGAQVRLTYTTLHLLTETTDTIPETDREALVSYAAAVLFDQLAAKYSGDSDSTILADSVNHGDKASRFASRASKLRQRYFDELGIDPKRLVAASVTVDLDMPNSQGRDRLTHPARSR